MAKPQIFRRIDGRRDFLGQLANGVLGGLAVQVGLANGFVTRPLQANEANQDLGWKGWRGNQRDSSVSGDPGPWPNSLQDANLKKQWQIELDRSYSGPLVSDGRVIITETIREKEECVKSIDRETGEVQWTNRWEGAMTVPFFAASNGSWIRSTPAIDGERLFVGGMRDYFVCINLETGKTEYSVDFVERFKSPLPGFGQVCSPLLDQGKVYMQSGGGLLCLQAENGQTIWRSLVEDDAMYGSAFSSPVIANIHGIRQIVVQTRTKICGIDLASDQVLWSHEVEAFRGMNILTPTVWDNAVFVSSYGGKTILLDLEPNQTGAWTVRERWTHKAEGYMSSPVVINDHLYIHLKNQRFSCFNLKTGEETWRSRPYGKYWSMVANRDQILALDQTGKLFLIQANPSALEIVDQRTVSEQECWAHLAVSSNQIYVRSLNGLTRWNWS